MKNEHIFHANNVSETRKVRVGTYEKVDEEIVLKKNKKNSGCAKIPIQQLIHMRV